ncbi:SDR family NAD(P)-dependent oxidoreductase [Dactylosporangium roseum]|uniref:SDR family NAD(P)-dependent oxidoreductase n=1 Tax=Dactylosporangium roseum TaxID=47989 RepID=A0ABY5ZEP3_9ACTN|nr:type I polyketide synthase [Dactylosporangium roseum]UWZ39420.1 SDR family NAD(P)-dependent oxidoreductase [Dactylosporangium roseum]
MAVEPIAIVGMAGRFPGSDDLEQFWANLAGGRDCLTDLDDEELLRYHERPERIAHPEYVRRRPVLAGSDAFDAELFGMTPREAELRDPQYRLMLEVVHSTLEHAGYDPGRYPGDIGLFAATNVNRYRYDYVEQNPELIDIVGYSAVDIANNADYMSTFVSYKLDLRGVSATVLTACSSSLVAIHLACTAIRAGDCDMAIAGGVDVEFPYHRGYVPLHGGLRATDGTVRSFAADASGTNFGDGVGAVLLKPLEAARRDGDTVYAVVLGSAVNNDGSRKVGYSAPSVSGQSDCVRRALRAAGVGPADISYVEAHGTATRVGDPIELAGLIDAFRASATGPLAAQYCAVGSVKSNVGHLGQAAGVAGVIKTVLALCHEQLPPSVNAAEPSPEIGWAGSPFFLSTELRDWPAEPGRPRRAGVSSFGIGGTNAHIVLQEAPAAPTTEPPRRPVEVLTWSAMNAEAEEQLRARLAGHFAGPAGDELPHAAYTLRAGRKVRPVRAALVARDGADAARALRDGDRVRRGDGVVRETAFAFPGQGSQYPGMYRRLYDDEPLFRDGCEAGFEVLRPLLGHDLRGAWLDEAGAAALEETGVAQPLLYVVEYTLAHCLMHWGVLPDVVLGHSLGELVAGAVAGVFGFEDGLRAVAWRARSMQDMPRGRMLAVTADPPDVEELLAGDVCLAAVNGPRQVVLSGPTEAIDAVAAELGRRRVRHRVLATSHAFHSPSMARAAERFEAELTALTLHAPEVPMLSAATGAAVGPDEATSPAFWARQLVQPVDFDTAAGKLFARGPGNVVESGPGSTLTALLRGRSDARASRSRCLTTNGPDDDPAALPDTLARLWVDGLPVRAWSDERGYRRVAVPGYPYQRRRYWIEVAPELLPARPQPAEAAAPAAPAAPAEPAGTRRRTAELRWVRAATAASRPATPHGDALLLAAADTPDARSAQAALQRAGYRTRLVVDRRRGTATTTAIDPTDPDDWRAELDAVASRGSGTVLLAHATTLDAPDGVTAATLEEQLARGLDALHGALAAAAGLQRRLRRPVRVVVLGRHTVDVTGGEPVNPATAALHGLLASAAREHPAVGCKLVDVGARAAEPAVADAIAREDGPLVAVRGAARWLPRLAPATRLEAGPALREGGTYLITGGLGGVGLVLARALADTGLRPRIALLGRTAPQERPDRADVEVGLAAIADAGAEIAVFTGDVADAGRLAAVADAVEARFGPISGVVHAAGIAGGGLLERRGRDDVRAVLRPKAGGALALDEVFARRAPLDFLLLCSSVAGLTGMYGSADYAAANAFLDAYSLTRSTARRRTLSVQWPGWSGVGMLARSPVAQAILAAGPSASAPSADTSADPDVTLEAVLEPGRDWQFDEHVFEGVPVLPGTSLLQLMVRGALAGGADWPLDLRDVVFLAPLVGEGPQRIRVRVRTVGTGERIILQSRPARGEGPWTEIATATRFPAEAPDVIADLDALTARLPQELDGEKAGWIDFGPRWRVLTGSWGDASERLARLVLPDSFATDLPAHPVHPALLDVAGGVLHGPQEHGAHAPFLYRRVLLAAPLPADVHVHARFAAQQRAGRAAVDFDLYDSGSGCLVLRAEGYVMRPVERPAFGARTASPASTAPAAQPEHGALLSPDEGAEVFLELLRTAAAPVVLVDLGSDPLGIAWIDRPDAEPAPEPARPATVTHPALSAPAAPAPAAGRDVAVELLALWSAALGVTDIDPAGDFFELGGNSLAAVQLISRINAHFGIDLGAGSLFDHSSLNALSKEITRLLGGGAA